MRCDFPQTHSRIRADTSLIIPRLQTSKMTQNLNVQIVVIQFRRQMDYGLRNEGDLLAVVPTGAHKL